MIRILLLFVMATFNMSAGADNTNKIVIDLGEHETGETVVHTVSIIETSDFLPPYRFFGKSCSCVVTKLGTDPNGTAQLTIKFNISKAGVNRDSVIVKSETSKTTRWYEFIIHAKEVFSVYPVNGYFKAKSEADKYIVTLKYFTPDQNAKAVFDGIETDIDELKCGQTITMQSYDEENKLKVFTFEVPLSYKTEDEQRQKTFSTTVNLLTSTSNGRR